MKDMPALIDALRMIPNIGMEVDHTPVRPRYRNVPITSVHRADLWETNVSTEPDRSGGDIDLRDPEDFFKGLDEEFSREGFDVLA